MKPARHGDVPPRSRRNAAAIAAIGLVLLLAGCGPPRNLFVLLDNPDGTVGKIEVAGGGAVQVLDRPRQSTGADRVGQTLARPTELKEEEIRSAFGAALGAQPELPVTYVLYFVTGTAELTDESRRLLPEITAAIARRKAPDVGVSGHADRTGSPEANMRLSLQRATAIRDALVADGVKESLIEVSSHGDNNPIVPTPRGVAEPRNRRVDVTAR